jgi:hypothetical protein
MTRSALHEIAVRRRGDADVKTLLLEIKRLHGVLVEAHEMTGPIYQVLPDLTERETVMRRLIDLLEAEPAIDDSAPVTYSEKPAETEGDRAAKRAARDRCG